MCDVSVNHQPSIGECFVKLYAKASPSADERVVGTAICADEDTEPLSTWVGDGLDFSRSDKGITKLEVDWKAEYTDPFFSSNTSAQIGITEGSFTITYDGQFAA